MRAVRSADLLELRVVHGVELAPDLHGLALRQDALEDLVLDVVALPLLNHVRLQVLAELHPGRSLQFFNRNKKPGPLSSLTLSSRAAPAVWVGGARGR